MFDPDKLYKSGDPALLERGEQVARGTIGAKTAGPRFVKLAQGKGGRRGLPGCGH